MLVGYWPNEQNIILNNGVLTLVSLVWLKRPGDCYSSLIFYVLLLCDRKFWARGSFNGRSWMLLILSTAVGPFRAPVRSTVVQKRKTLFLSKRRKDFFTQFYKKNQFSSPKWPGPTKFHDPFHKFSQFFFFPKESPKESVSGCFYFFASG